MHKAYICDDVISSGGCTLPTNPTTEAFESFSATIYIIGCWLKALEHNFLELSNLYTNYMEELFQKKNVDLPKQRSPKETCK